jgi:hypothetical protein
MAWNLDKATLGEQGVGFCFGGEGFFLVDGPSGTQGHAANAPGFDGVAYHILRDMLIIYDNKTFRSTRGVGSATAIDPVANLTQNLDGLIAKVTNMRDLPAQSRILDLLRQTRSSITSTSVSPPSNVKIAITNYGGNSTRLTQRFAGRGITFIDMNSAPKVPAPSARIYINEQTVPRMVLQQQAVATYEARRDKAAALAEGGRFIAQGANDLFLKYAIEGELKRLVLPIGDMLARGGGALVVLTIETAAPPGNVGMVETHSVNSAFVFGYPNNRFIDKQTAVTAWDVQPKLSRAPAAHETIQTRLYWVAPRSLP